MQILEIYRDRVQPGKLDEFRIIEEDAARACAELGCPHPHLALETLTGAKEVWWVNAFDSEAHKQAIIDAYAKNTALMEALKQISLRKAGIVFEPSDLFVERRAELSRGEGWVIGRDRYAVGTLGKQPGKLEGTVFESADQTFFVLSGAPTQEGANRKGAAVGTDAIILVVRPYWGMPAKEWLARDPEFWSVNPSAPR